MMRDLNNWSKGYSSIIFGDKQNRLNITYSVDQHLKSSTRLCSHMSREQERSVLLLRGRAGDVEGGGAHESYKAASPRGGPMIRIRCTWMQELPDANAI
jgi:hypothetical protein